MFLLNRNWILLLSCRDEGENKRKLCVYGWRKVYSLPSRFFVAKSRFLLLNYFVLSLSFTLPSHIVYYATFSIPFLFLNSFFYFFLPLPGHQQLFIEWISEKCSKYSHFNAENKKKTSPFVVYVEMVLIRYKKQFQIKGKYFFKQYTEWHSYCYLMRTRIEFHYYTAFN